MGRRRTRTIYFKPKRESHTPIPLQEEVKSKKSKLKILWNGISKFWKIVGVVIAIGGGIYTFVKLYDRFFPAKENPPKEKSDKEKFTDKYLDTGTLYPRKLNADSGYTILENPPIFTTPIINDSFPKVIGLKLQNKTSQIVNFFIGTSLIMISKETLRRGIKFKPPVVSSNQNHCGEINFVLYDDMVYASVEFKDFLKEETVGWIDYNHWKVYSSNTLDYPKNDSSKLEVIDKQHNIIFSINYKLESQNGNYIFVSGYFIEPYHGISIIACTDNPIIKRVDTCILYNKGDWKEKAYPLLSDIKTIFPQSPK